MVELRTRFVRLVISLGLLTGCVTAKPEPRPPTPSPSPSPSPKAPVAIERSQLVPLATYRVTRQVGMFYQLDLFESNVHSRKMARVIQNNDASLRSCYMRRLEAKPKLRGGLALSFSLSKRTGSMSHIKRIGGSLADAELFTCLKARLAALNFDPPKDMRGKLTYLFKVVEES